MNQTTQKDVSYKYPQLAVALLLKGMAAVEDTNKDNGELSVTVYEITLETGEIMPLKVVF